MNYQEIVDTALSYADRQDDEVVTRIDKFLRIVESRINRKLKVRHMSGIFRIQMRIDDEYYELPADFGSLRDIEVRPSIESNTRYTASLVTPEFMNTFRGSMENSEQPKYVIIGRSVQVSPPYDGWILEIVYHRRVCPLTAVDSENWVSDVYPDLYVFGALTEISAFVKDKESTVLWHERFTSLLDEIELDDAISRWSGTPPVMRAL